MDTGRSRHETRGRKSLAAPGAAAMGLDLPGLFSCLGHFPDPVLIADNRKRIVFLNQAATELLGSSVDPAKESPLCADLLRVDMAGEAHCFVDLCLERREHLHGVPVRIQGRQGSWHHLAVTATYVDDRDGNPAACFAVLREIREDHRTSPEAALTRAELRKANNFLANIIKSSVDGIVVVDMRGNVLIFNEGAERILGYTAEEAERERHIMRRIFSPELARELMRRMRSPEHGPPGKLNPIRLTFTRKDGQEVPVSFSAAIITEGGEEIASVGIFSDRTERVRLQRELEDAQRQVVQAEKIASLGRLAAGVAHEINNPLAGILIYAEALLKEIGDRPQWREDLQEIVDQTLRCKQIVTRLLEFSRQSLGERVLFDLNEIIGRCVDLLARQSLFHDVQIVLDLERELPQIVGDPGELQQVCANLMINAADAMLGRGRLDIKTRSMPKTEEVILEFADTGPGIAPEIREKIFEPFFTTKPLGSGTGLGLSVVYGIIQRHNGTIEVASPPGGGATFIIKLPLQAPSPKSNTAGA